MGIVVLLLLGLGFILSLIGGIWGLILAFQDSIVWGLLYFFVPFAALVFFILRWNNPSVRKAFLLSLGGLLLTILAAVLAPIFGESFLPATTPPLDDPIAIPEDATVPTTPTDEVPAPDATAAPDAAPAPDGTATPAPETAPATTDTPAPTAQNPVDPNVDYDYTQSMEVGYAAFEQGDYQTALINFRRALQARPGDRYATDAIANTEAIINRN